MATTQDSDVVGPVQAFWRYKFVVVPICILAGLLGAYLGYSMGGTTKATTAMYLTDPRGVPLFRNGSTAPADFATYTMQRAQFAQSSDVLAKVSTEVAGDETVDTLRDAVTATGGPDGGIVVICRKRNPARAVEICESVTDAYRSLSLEEAHRKADITVAALEAARDALPPTNSSTSAINEMNVKIADMRAAAAQFGSGIEFVEATDTTVESKISPAIQYGIAAFCFALLLTGAACWVIAARHPRVHDGRDASLLLEGPLVGVVDSGSRAASLDTLATNLGDESARGVVVVTSADSSIIRSDIVAHLGEAWALEGRRVTIIDLSENGRLAGSLGTTSDGPGLFDSLVQDGWPGEYTSDVVLGSGARLRYLPAGTRMAHEGSALRTDQARTALQTVEQDNDVVLVDVDSILDSPAGAAIANMAAGVVVVVRKNTERQVLDDLRTRLDVLQVALLGVVYEP